tara:strand:+ start:6112 stop:6246 length:135 start_codon:yes stop_codon:yes gene_type:complete
LLQVLDQILDDLVGEIESVCLNVAVLRVLREDEHEAGERANRFA